MGQQIARYLIDVVFGLFTYALLLRFVMQVMRAPFRNPVGQAVIALTDWIVKPLRRVLPGVKGVDWASLVATFVLQFLWLLAYALVFGGFSLAGVGIPFLLLATVVALVRAVLWLAVIVVFVHAILSWIAPDGPLSGLLNALSFPLLRPVRRILPPIGGTLDLSPLVVIVIAQLLLMMLPHAEASLTAMFLGLGGR
ncbi:MAG: YggT family protein [Burkholderiales bacterium]|nr:YggT family protein [Burkholderiales bacterium]